MSTETRVFESVDSSPEAKAANAAYFAEQGAAHEVKDGAAKGSGTPTEEAAKPAETAAPATGSEPADTVVDAETAADWDSAQTDAKRRSRYAKKRQEHKELQEKTQVQERELAELRAKLAAPATDQPKPGDTASPAAGAPAATDATAGEKFSEPEPAEPKYEDFANEDDQLLAYQKALAKHGRDWGRWDRRRDKFEETQAAKQSQQSEEARKAQETRLAQLNERIAEIRKLHPDFDDVLKNGTVLSMALSGVSTSVPGGLERAYLLAKDPVKLKQFNELTTETQMLNGKPIPTQKAWDLALYLLGQVEVPTAAETKSPAPAGTPPAASPSSSSQPREEQPAITPARGRASAEPRREDLSGDARRDQLAAELR